MLKVENLSIHFEDRSEREEVVKNVSFAVENGDILGIVGESGSGKTMTALTIAGLLKKHAVLDGGRVWLDDTDIPSTAIPCSSGIPFSWSVPHSVFRLQILRIPPLCLQLRQFLHGF